MMCRYLPLAAASLFGCAPDAPSLPVQTPQQVVSLFASAVRACTAGLTPAGEIDQAAMARSGWRVVRRRLIRYDGTHEPRDLDLKAYPTLRTLQVEATEWAQDGVSNRIDLTRSPAGPDEMHDECSIDAQTENLAAAERVLGAMRRGFGRPPDRTGWRPRGGDALTPGFGDRDSTILLWSLPRNDAYLIFTESGYLRLEVVAMQDRAALQEYHPDLPTMRIPVLEGE